MQLLVGRHVPWSLTSGQGQTGYCERKGRPLLGHLPPKLVTCNLAFSPIPGLSLGTWTGRACFIVLFVSNRDPRPCLAFWVVLFSWTVLFSWQLFHFTNLSLPFLLSTFKKSYFTLVVWFFFVCNLFTENKKLQTLKADPHIQGAWTSSPAWVSRSLCFQESRLPRPAGKTAHLGESRNFPVKCTWPPF